MRSGSACHYSQQEILAAFQCKFALLSSAREEGQQDLHEAYQVQTLQSSPGWAEINRKVFIKILLAAKSRFRKTGEATINILRITKMMNSPKIEKKRKKQPKKR